MNINRNNYELYFINCLEGLLSEEEKSFLFLFLENNPDLKEEFEQLKETVLVPSEISFPAKKSIKKNIIAVDEINERSYENYFIANLENDLSLKEKQNLLKFLDLNPFLKQEQKVTQATLLKADTNIVFPEKGSLKKTAVFQISMQVWAAAASIVILLGISLYFFYTKSPNNLPEIVKKDSISLPDTIHKFNDKKQTEEFVPPAQYTQIPVKKTAIFPSEKKKKSNPEKNYSTVGKEPAITHETTLVKTDKNTVKKDSAYKIPEKIPVNEFNNQLADDTKIKVQKQEALSLKEYAALLATKKLLKEEIPIEKEEKPETIALISATAKILNKIAGTRFRTRYKKNDNNDLTTFALGYGNFEISRTTKSK